MNKCAFDKEVMEVTLNSNGNSLMVNLVSQATPFAVREGSGHTATTELSLRNAIIEHSGWVITC